MKHHPDMACNDCAYFDDLGGGSGRCLRRPPVIVDAIVAKLIAAKDDDDTDFDSDILEATFFPIVGMDWGCGDGLLREEAAPLPEEPKP